MCKAEKLQAPDWFIDSIPKPNLLQNLICEKQNQNLHLPQQKIKIMKKLVPVLFSCFRFRRHAFNHIL